jgi:tetrapyrrole methylase family protein/MazG family protein
VPEVVRSIVAPFPDDHPLVLVQFSEAGIPVGHPVTIAELEAMNLPRETRLILVHPLDRLADRRSFDTLLHIVARLRAPDGCPWDREQTYGTIKKHLIEESYEAIAALDEGDLGQFAEELGDIMLQVVMYAQLARESSDFTLDDVLEAVNEKLIRRHPHVFGDVTVQDSADVLKNWEKIKRAERSGKPSTFGVPEAAPALMRAEAIQSRAERYGWEQPTENPSFDAVGDAGADKVEQLVALGSALFDAVSVARRYQLDPEEALRLATNRFRTSFDRILSEMHDRGIDFDTLSIGRKRDILAGVTTSPRPTEFR